MKKNICLILCLMMLISVFASCNDAQTNESSDVSDNPNSDTVSSETSSDDIVYNGGEDIEKLFTTVLPADREYINVAKNAKYTFSREPSDKYPDSGNLLTDSVHGSLESVSGFVGFIGKKPIEITLDLGRKIDGICGFSIDNIIDTEYGRGTPRSAVFYVSDDGENYVKAASSAVYTLMTGGGRRIYKIEAYTEKGFSARYVRLVLDDILINWTLLDEFKVYTCTEKKPEEPIHDEETYYRNDDMPNVTEELYWDSSESGFEDQINLISGLGQRIYSHAALSDELKTGYYNTPASITALTDGKHGKYSYNDPSNAHFTGGAGRDIIYDLGKLSSVNYATIDCMVATNAGINVPEMVIVQLSEDGVEWQTVAVERASSFAGYFVGKETWSKLTITFNAEAYKARFVKFAISISSHCWMSEIEVFGSKKIADNAKKLEGPSASIGDDMYVNAYPSLDVLGGSENIYLAYNYKVENRAAGLRSKEQYKPLVGYYDKDGNLKDFFFDSYLYLPCSTTCPSGGLLWESESQPSVMSDWLDYEADLWADGYNIQALNEAVGEVKKELGQPDYKAYVYLSIFNLASVNNKFGDIDGDGVVENANNLGDRIKIAQWWIDRNIEKYNAAGFENLKLNGFYWYDEGIGLGDAEKRQMIDFIVNYVHSKGYYIIWIPYYQASGYSSWKDCGFDCANMQPNYMFVEGSTEQRVYDNAKFAAAYGMGVEIEADGNVFSGNNDAFTPSRYDRYLSYLKVGVEKGYMNSIKMYYCDAVPGVYLSAYNNSDPKYHAIYDITYLYAKRKLSLDDPGKTFDDTPVVVTANEKFSGNLVSDNAYGQYTIKYGPRHGSFALASNGAYKYTPDENFVGEDTIVLTLNNGMAVGEVTLTIRVEPAK